MTRVSCCSDDVVRYRECHAAASVAWPRVSRCHVRDVALATQRVSRCCECCGIVSVVLLECHAAASVAVP